MSQCALLLYSARLDLLWPNLFVRLIVRIRVLSGIDLPIQGPLDSALTITAQATVFNNWSSIWDLPPQPFGVEDVQLRGEATVPLTLVPYGSAKVYKLSMWPLVLNTSSGH